MTNTTTKTPKRTVKVIFIEKAQDADYDELLEAYNAKDEEKIVAIVARVTGNERGFKRSCAKEVLTGAGKLPKDPEKASDDQAEEQTATMYIEYPVQRSDKRINKTFQMSDDMYNRLLDIAEDNPQYSMRQIINQLLRVAGQDAVTARSNRDRASMLSPKATKNARIYKTIALSENMASQMNTLSKKYFPGLTEKALYNNMLNYSLNKYGYREYSLEKYLARHAVKKGVSESDED